MRLTGKLILLTGASGGIGRAIAGVLAQQGARLILVGRSGTKLSHLASELKVFANQGFVLRADITTHAGREIIRTALLALQQPLDALINCAGVNLFGFLNANNPEDIDRLIATNITAPILLTRQALPYLNRDTGRIINIGSAFGGLGYPGFSVYCASKFALRGFSEALRRELADTKLQVGYLAPRATNTDLNSDAINAMNRELGNAVDDPGVVAAYVLRMLTERRMRDRTIGWPERLFVRINSVIPNLVDKALRKQLPIIRRYARPPQPTRAATQRSGISPVVKHEVKV